MGNPVWTGAGVAAAIGLSSVALVLALQRAPDLPAEPALEEAPGEAVPAPPDLEPGPAAGDTARLHQRIAALERRLDRLEGAPAPAGTHQDAAQPPAGTPAAGAAGAPAGRGYRPPERLSGGDPVPADLPTLVQFLKRVRAEPEASGKRGVWYLTAGDADALDADRAALLEALLARHPGHEHAQGYFYRLLTLHTTWGRHERVVELLQRYGATTGIGGVKRQVLRGFSLAAAGDHQRARQELEPLLRQTEVPPIVRLRAYLGVGRALAELGDRAAERSLYQQMLAETDKVFVQNAGTARLAIARSFRDEGRTDEAIAAYRELLDEKLAGGAPSLAARYAKVELAPLEAGK